MQPDYQYRIYREQIPAFVESELDRLYGSRYSCLGHFERSGNLERASTYVVTCGAQIVTLLLFRQCGAVVALLNEGISLTADEVRRFTAALFAAEPRAAAVLLHLVHLAGPARCGFVCQQDLVLALPASVDAYLSGLGKSTRDNLKRYLSKFKRSFPAFRFELLEQRAVAEDAVRAIVHLNRLRMAGKRKLPSIDAAQERDIVEQVRRDGFVGLLRIDGQVAAGVITYRIGTNFNLRILAHDAAFDAYRLGLLCCYLTVCACIARQTAGRFYFGWGDEAYKSRLGGRPRQLRRLVVYRSAWHGLRHPGPWLAAAAAGWAYQLRSLARRWAAGAAGVAPRLGAGLPGLVRRIKRFDPRRRTGC